MLSLLLYLKLISLESVCCMHKSFVNFAYPSQNAGMFSGKLYTSFKKKIIADLYRFDKVFYSLPFSPQVQCLLHF